jgi:hypothetical protein
VFDEVKLEDLETENGFDILLKFMDNILGNNTIGNSIVRFEEYEDYRKQESDTIFD